jgi:hypothetical protein
MMAVGKWKIGTKTEPRIHRLTIDTKKTSDSTGISVHMLCSEYLRLRQHYDAVPRRQAQVELSSNKRELFDTPARMAAEVEKGEPQTLRRSMNFGEEDKVRSLQQTRLSWEHGDSLRWKSRDADLVN